MKKLLGRDSLHYSSGMFLGLAICRFRDWNTLGIVSGCVDLVVMLALLLAAERKGAGQ